MRGEDDDICGYYFLNDDGTYCKWGSQKCVSSMQQNPDVDGQWVLYSDPKGTRATARFSSEACSEDAEAIPTGQWSSKPAQATLTVSLHVSEAHSAPQCVANSNAPH